MPSIVDEFVVTLGLDPKKFDEGQRKAFLALDKAQTRADRAEEKSFKGRIERERKLGQSIGSVAKQAIGLFAVLAGANSLKNFAGNVFETNLRTGLLARNLGLSANALSKWQGAAKAAGGSAEDVSGAMQGMVNDLQELQLTGTMSGQKMGIYRLLGINNPAELRDIEGTLFKIADQFAKMDPARAQALGAGLGYSPGMVNLLMKGSAGVKGALGRQPGISEDDVARAAKLHEKMVELQAAITRLGTDALTPLVPLLERSLAAFMEIAGVIKSLDWDSEAKAIRDVGDALGELWEIGGGDRSAPLRQVFNWFVSQTKALASGLKVVAHVLKGEFREALAEAKNFKIASEGYLTQDPADAMAPAGKPGQRAAQAVQFFMSKGWSRQQAIGMTASMQGESGAGLDDRAVGDGGAAYGIAQWHPDRQANFKAWAKKDIRASTFAEQLAFSHYELTQGKEQAAGAKIRAATTAGRAAAEHVYNYERPADKAGEAQKRAQAAYGLERGLNAQAQAAAKPPAAGGKPTVKNDTKVDIGELHLHTVEQDPRGLGKALVKGIGDAMATSQAGQTGLF